MRHLRLSLFALLTLMLTSCELVKDNVYPIIDYVTVTKNTSEIYARHDVYASDTMCLDTLLVRAFSERKNISSRYQYIMESPKVSWQKSHLQWIASKSGAKVRKYLLMTLIVLALGGFLVIFLISGLQKSIGERRLSHKQKSAQKAMDSGNYEKAEKLYEECELMDVKIHTGRSIDTLQYRVIPYVMLAMVLVEGIYLFMFNFNMPLISFIRVSPWNCIVNTLFLTLAMMAQLLMMWLYSEELDDNNGCNSVRWWRIPIKYLLGIALGVVVLKNTFVMPLDLISIAMGGYSCFFVLTKNKAVTNPEVKVYAVTLLLSSYIFMYFLSYVLLLIVAYVFIVIGFVFCLKLVGTSSSYAVDRNNIQKRMFYSPGKTYEQVSHEYYAEKRQEAIKKYKQQKNIGL